MEFNGEVAMSCFNAWTGHIIEPDTAASRISRGLLIWSSGVDLFKIVFIWSSLLLLGMTELYSEVKPSLINQLTKGWLESKLSFFQLHSYSL